MELNFKNERLKNFSKENIHNQIKNAQYKNGYFVLNFYIDENNKFSKTSTSKIENFIFIQQVGL